MLKPARKGISQKISHRHLHRHVTEFAGQHNVLDLNSLAQMATLAARLVGTRLMRRDLIADNRLPSGARSSVRAGRAPSPRAWRLRSLVGFRTVV